MAIDTGWGRDSWGSGPWNQPADIEVSVSGLSATSALGTTAQSAAANTPVTEQGATSGLGTLAFIGKANVAVTERGATAALAL